MSIELNTQQLTLLIATYRQTNRKFPESWEEIEAPRASFTDPWGNLLTFKIATAEGTGKTRVTYTSRGPDGEIGTGDDLVRTDDLSN